MYEKLLSLPFPVGGAASEAMKGELLSPTLVRALNTQTLIQESKTTRRASKFDMSYVKNISGSSSETAEVFVYTANCFVGMPTGLK